MPKNGGKRIGVRENNCDRKIVSNPGVRMEKVAGEKKRIVKDEIEIEKKAKK